MISGTGMEVGVGAKFSPLLRISSDTSKAYVVYRITCSCGKVYIRETQRTPGTRIKELQDACRLYRPEKSAVAEHAWCNDQGSTKTRNGTNGTVVFVAETKVGPISVHM